jgi:hypothetical protein
MSCHSGPNIVKNGLLFAKDTNNIKSYSKNRFISYGTGLTTQAVTFEINGTGLFNRVAAGTVIEGYIVKSNDVVYSYALNENGCHYHGNDVSIPAGVYATFSFDYLVTGATTYPIINYLANFESVLGLSIVAPNNLQNVWQRVSGTSGPTSSVGTLRMLLYPGGCSGSRLADTGTIYFRNPKVEYTTVDTGPENYDSKSTVLTAYDISNNNKNGTLANGTSIILDGKNASFSFDGIDDHIIAGNFGTLPTQGTISFWMNSTAVENYRNPLSTNYSGGNVGFRWEQYTTASPFGGFSLAVGNDAGTYTSYSYLPSTTLSANTWHNVVCTWNTSTNTLIGYLNGVQSFSTSSHTYWPSNIPNFCLGNGFSTDRYFKGKIAFCAVQNVALTASEIKQNFNALRGRFGI